MFSRLTEVIDRYSDLRFKGLIGIRIAPTAHIIKPETFECKLMTTRCTKGFYRIRANSKQFGPSTHSIQIGNILLQFSQHQQNKGKTNHNQIINKKKLIII